MSSLLLILLFDFFHRGFKHCEATTEPGAQFTLLKGREQLKQGLQTPIA